MVHKQLTDGDYFSVGASSTNSKVLLQLGNKHGDQARVALTPVEALIILAELSDAIRHVVDETNNQNERKVYGEQSTGQA